MNERMYTVREHIDALHAQADAERLAHHHEDEPIATTNVGGSIRQRAGHALVALGTLLEGHRDECENCPDPVTA